MTGDVVSASTGTIDLSTSDSFPSFDSPSHPTILKQHVREKKKWLNKTTILPLGTWMSTSGDAGAPSDCSDSIVASQSDKETWLTGREVDVGWDTTCSTNCSAN